MVVGDAALEDALGGDGDRVGGRDRCLGLAAMLNAKAVSIAGRVHVGVWPGAAKESVEHVLPFLR
jgi:hypothetical protein